MYLEKSNLRKPPARQKTHEQEVSPNKSKTSRPKPDPSPYKKILKKPSGTHILRENLVEYNKFNDNVQITEKL